MSFILIFDKEERDFICYAFGSFLPIKLYFTGIVYGLNNLNYIIAEN